MNTSAERCDETQMSTSLGPFNVVLYQPDEAPGPSTRQIIKLRDGNDVYHTLRVVNECDYTTLSKLPITPHASEANAVLYYVREEHAPEPNDMYNTSMMTRERADETTPTGALHLAVLNTTHDTPIKCYWKCFGISRSPHAHANTHGKQYICRRCYLSGFNSEVTLLGHQQRKNNISFCEQNMAAAAVRELKEQAELQHALIDSSHPFRHINIDESSAAAVQLLLEAVQQQQRHKRIQEVQAQATLQALCSAPLSVALLQAFLQSDLTQTAFEAQQEPTPRASGSDVNIPANSIILPVAFGNDTQMRIAGPPQTIVPVILPKKNCHDATSTWRSLIPPVAIQTPNLTGVQQPLELHLNNAKKLSIHLVAGDKTPLSRKNSLSEQPVDLSKTATASPQVEQRSASFSISNTLTPTKNTLRLPIPSIDTRPTPPTTAEKPFPCECGVSFSKEETLNGHKRMYCVLADKHANDNLNNDKENGTDMRRVTKHATQQRRRPAATTNSASATAKNNPPTCAACGYRACSSRGLRSHAQNGHCTEMHSDKSPTSGMCSSQQPTPNKVPRRVCLCDDCHCTFDTESEYQAHACRSKSRTNRTPTPPRKVMLSSEALSNNDTQLIDVTD